MAKALGTTPEEEYQNHLSQLSKVGELSELPSLTPDV